MNSMTDSLSNFVVLNEEDIMNLNGGGIKEVFIIGGKVLATAGTVVVAAGTISGSGGLATPLVVGGAAVTIAGIWAL